MISAVFPVSVFDTSAKLSQQKEKAEFFYNLFSESGFDDNLIAEAEKDEHLTLVGIEDVVNGDL